MIAALFALTACVAPAPTSSAPSSSAPVLDLTALWDFSKPAVSEQRFQQAMKTASTDQQRILQTQIARTYGLRRDFAKARQLLRELAPSITSGQASAEAQARYWLEWGRSYASATHRDEQLNADDRQHAHQAFSLAARIAKAAGLDGLVVDALHMQVFAEADPKQQRDWTEQALAVALQSTQADARRWEASLRHNLGYDSHKRGDFDAALEQFRLSRDAHARAGRDRQTRVADWMIAWTLRAQGKLQHALALQTELEQQWAAAGQTDPYVFDELALLHQAMGNTEAAQRYHDKAQQARSLRR